MSQRLKACYSRLYECKAVLMTTYFSQGSAATDLRGGDSFNSNFLHRSIVILTVKKNYENWSTFVEFIARQNWPETFDSPCSFSFYLVLEII